MITKEEILRLQELSIDANGGVHVIRDARMLVSAIARPFQAFGGEGLYVIVCEKTAALGESLIENHPFVDGNKRTGALAMFTFLMEHNIEIITSNTDFYNFIIAILLVP